MENELIAELEKFLYSKGLKRTDVFLMIEAFRRKIYFNATYHGLWYPSEFKGSKYVTAYGTPKPRVLNWVVLTSLGNELFDEMAKTFTLPTDKKEREDLNKRLFEYN